MDLKYGYIAEKDKFFFQLSLIDVYDKNIISYHLGLSCKAKDASRVLKRALAKRKLAKGMKLPVIRTDNGPQFIAKKFQKTCEKLEIKHQRIPVKTPNMNAHIESFHAILEKDCYQRYEFRSYPEVYRAVSKYVNYYNNRYRHGSIGDIPPAKYLEKLQNEEIKSTSFIA